MRNQEQQANASTGATVGNGILPKSTNIRLSSDVSDQQHEVRELQVNDDARQTRTSSELFRRLMSMDTLQSMSVRNLMANNPVFRRKALSMTINIVSRTLTLGMNVVLVLISTAFCVSQLSEVHLKLYSECEPKTLEEIYHHSYMAGLQENGSVEINAETQWGWTKDACYTTRSFQENTDQLWYSNYYEHEWNIHIDYTVVLFGMTAFYASCVLVYNLVNLVRDIYHLKRNTLHTLSDQARDHLNGPEQETRAWTKFTNWLNDLVETENTRWVLRCVFLECVEFGVAVSCMWLYNGYNWNDPENKNDVYLAEKPQFIILFAAGLAANMIGSAILWMSYVAAPEMCHGLTFRTAFFFVEDLSDLFYTVFPAIVVFNDSFNANSDELLVLLGQFHVNDFMGFSTRFFFLATLCFKTHHLVYSAHFKLVNRYYSEFHLEEERANWIKEDDPRRDDKRCFLFIVSALYIAAGIVVLVLVSTHFTKAEAHCNSIREAIFIVDGVFTSDIYLELEQKTLLQTNPELFLWDQCLHQRCQCRVFVVDWDSLETSTEDLTDLDLSQIKILTATLENYIMLEKFQTKGGVDPNADFTFNQNMLRSIHMKAFQWPIGTLDVAAMQGNDFGDFMALWTELEYLEIPADCNFGEFQNFNQLVTLTYLRVKLLCGSQPEKYWALDSICACKNLQILSIGLQGVQKTIPHCFGDLLDLIVLDLSLSMSLREVPFSIFELPKLKRLDLFRGIISWDSLLNYNLPMDLDRDDTVGVQSWLRYHFSFNENANFYLQLNPICDEISSVESDKLRALLEKSCRYECSAGVANSFCTPQLIGDGICEPVCNVIGCNYDGGDCIQLCFAEELTDCSRDDLYNEKCDEPCNNDYCSAYQNLAGISGVQDLKYDPDFEHCISNPVSAACQNSSIRSTYLDTRISWNADNVCDPDWIGDSNCDDSCQTEECSYDKGDCALLCTGVCFAAGAVWTGGVDPERLWKVDPNHYCGVMWQGLVGVVGEFPGSDNCLETLQSMDFNQDGLLNFREFSALFGHITFRSEDSRALQLNCSSCMTLYDAPMEYYNI